MSEQGQAGAGGGQQGGDAAAAAAAAAAGGQGGGQQGSGQQGGGQQQGGGDPWWAKADLGLDQDTANFYASRNAPSLAEALKSGMHAHKAVTDRNVLQKPDPANLAAWDGWKEIGWTENRADYKLETPKAKAPQGYPYNEGLETAFVDAAHELRVPPALAGPLLERTMAKSFAEFEALTSAYAEDDRKTEATLRTEWGSAYDANKALGERAFRHFAPEGMDMAMLSEVMGSPGVVKMFAEIGKAFGEERLVLPGGGGQLGGKSETTLRAELNQLQNDPGFMKALMDPRDARHTEFNDKRNRLLEEIAKVAKPR